MILESDAVKELTSKGMDAVMSVKNDAEEAFQDVNENTEDTVVDSKAKTTKINITENE